MLNSRPRDQRQLSPMAMGRPTGAGVAEPAALPGVGALVGPASSTLPPGPALRQPKHGANSRGSGADMVRSRRASSVNRSVSKRTEVESNPARATAMGVVADREAGVPAGVCNASEGAWALACHAKDDHNSAQTPNIRMN